MSVHLSMLLILAVVILLGLLGFAAGIRLLRRSRGDQSEPLCGHCGYNLTGSEANRCPECGRPFIEAGIRRAGGGRRKLGAALVISSLSAIVVITAGGVVSMLVAHARALKQAAVAMRQAQAVEAEAFQARMLAEAERSPGDFNKDGRLDGDDVQEFVNRPQRRDAGELTRKLLTREQSPATAPASTAAAHRP